MTWIRSAYHHHHRAHKQLTRTHFARHIGTEVGTHCWHHGTDGDPPVSEFFGNTTLPLAIKMICRAWRSRSKVFSAGKDARPVRILLREAELALAALNDALQSNDSSPTALRQSADPSRATWRTGNVLSRRLFACGYSLQHNQTLSREAPTIPYLKPPGR